VELGLAAVSRSGGAFLRTKPHRARHTMEAAPPARRPVPARSLPKPLKWTESWTAYAVLLGVGLVALALAAGAIGIAAFGEASGIARALDCQGNGGACVLVNGTDLVLASPDQSHTARLSTIDDGPFGSALSLEVRTGTTNGDQSRYVFRGDGTIEVRNAAGQASYTLSRDCLGQGGNAACTDF